MTVKELRNKLGMTQGSLARAVGVSRSTINQIEREALLPGFEVADKIASCFKVPVEEIFPRFKRQSPYPKHTSKAEV